MRDLCHGTDNWNRAGNGSCIALESDALLNAVEAALTLGEMKFFEKLLVKSGPNVPNTVLAAIRKRLDNGDLHFEQIAEWYVVTTSRLLRTIQARHYSNLGHTARLRC